MTQCTLQSHQAEGQVPTSGPRSKAPSAQTEPRLSAPFVISFGRRRKKNCSRQGRPHGSLVYPAVQNACCPAEIEMSGYRDLACLHHELIAIAQDGPLPSTSPCVLRATLGPGGSELAILELDIKSSKVALCLNKRTNEEGGSPRLTCHLIPTELDK